MAKRQLKAIREKCLDCCCGQREEIRACPVRGCSLWPYRFGVGPSTARKRGEDVGLEDDEEEAKEEVADGEALQNGLIS